MRRVSGVVIGMSPVVLAVGYYVLLNVRSTRPTALSMLKENQPVELLTFASLFLGAVMGMLLARRVKKRGGGRMVYGFFAIFSVGLFVTSMEEVAWGQAFFDFETPQFIEDINRQDETTLHNIRGIHNKTEFFRIAFGLGGLLGVWLGRFQRFQPIAAPRVLLPWFVVITLLAGLDLHNDYYTVQKQFDRNIHKLSELVEMMVGFAGVLYIWLKGRRGSGL